LSNVKTKVSPVITGAYGTISKSYRKYPSNVPGEDNNKGPKKTAILDTTHVLRKVIS
jgi:hypothetical protein